MKVAIRVDGNKEMGFGHMYRQRSLSQAFPKDTKIFFLTKTPLDAKAVIGEAQIIALEENDLEQVLSFVKENSIDVVITDNYNLDENYLSELHRACAVATVDDLNHLEKYDVDLIINQNIYGKDLDYNCGNCKVLGGTEYAIIGENFVELDREEKLVNETPKMLVTFGGADKHHLAVKVADALSDFEEKIHAVFVLGNGFEDKELLNKELESWSNSFEILHDVKNMAPVILGCDFAVSAAGTTTYELAYCGTPTISICQADNQKDIAAGMQKAEFSINLGDAQDVLAEEIRDAVQLILLDKELRERMANVGKNLVDGRGAERVAEAIAGLAK